MMGRVKNLASLMRMRRDQGDEKLVLMLGAGASLSSGVPSTTTIMTELLAANDNENTGGDIAQRFDQLWKRTPDATRRGFLTPYLERDTAPSVGYEKLAELIKAGYFDVILSFNFDQLLERALKKAGVDFRRVIRGETIESEMQKLVSSRTPRCKLVKPHGSLDSADHYLFDAAEMLRYPEPIEALVREVTSRDIVICGYGFKDTCVLRSFADRGGSVFCVNPDGAPGALSVVLKDRLSEDNEIRARFDDFFTALHGELLAPEPEVDEKPPANPFKFLESYDEQDAEIFRERDDEIADFFIFLERKPPSQVIVISGPSKAGKTSLVRAGLLARLDPEKYLRVYVRCRTDVESQLPTELAARGLVPAGLDLPAALAALAASSPQRRVVLFLDQFDRVTTQEKLLTKQGQRELSTFLRTRLFVGVPENLTLVLVVTDAGDVSLGATLMQECDRSDLRRGSVLCHSFDRQNVIKIIESLASTAGFVFDGRIIEDLADSFEKGRNADAKVRFTLAHVHAICHVLAATKRVGFEAYRGTFDRNLDALHQAINVVEFMNFAEDCDYPMSAWFRNMVKVPLREGKDGIAAFIKAHYEELLPARERIVSERNGKPVGAGR
jgi:hypothetical protein